MVQSQAMYHLGVDTTRALSLVVSDGGEMAERPWYSDGNRDRDPAPRVSELGMDRPRTWGYIQ
jgi:hypothetical protein